MPARAITTDFHAGCAPRAFGARILDAVPTLRAFARGLEPDRGKADGLVREAVTKVIAAGPLVAGGGDLRVCLLTILHNSFYAERRQLAAEPLFVPVVSPAGADPPGRGGLRQALDWLPVEQIEALMLVSGLGFGYLQAAAICGTDANVVKSRAACARRKLRETMVAMAMNGSLHPHPPRVVAGSRFGADDSHSVRALPGAQLWDPSRDNPTAAA